MRDAINLPLSGVARSTSTSRRRAGSSPTPRARSPSPATTWCSATARRRSRSTGNPLLSGGLTLPRVRLGDLGGRVAIDKGVAKLQGIDGQVARRRPGAGGRGPAARSARQLDGQRLPALQVHRRVPQAGGRAADDPADGGLAGQAAGRVLRHAPVGAARPAEPARAVAHLAGDRRRAAAASGDARCDHPGLPAARSGAARAAGAGARGDRAGRPAAAAARAGAPATPASARAARRGASGAIAVSAATGLARSRPPAGGRHRRRRATCRPQRAAGRRPAAGTAPFARRATPATVTVRGPDYKQYRRTLSQKVERATASARAARRRLPPLSRSAQA